jgi:heme/copper-type cytochrome/quinol oxidase subunit 1
MAGYLVHSLVRGRRAAANPWGAKSLEWQTASPPPAENFLAPVTVHEGPYEFDEIEGDDVPAHTEVPVRP